MPPRKTRIARKPHAKAAPRKRATARKVVKLKAKTKAKARPRIARKAPAPPPKPPPVVTITLGPHHVDRSLGSTGFKVHPAPTMHPVGPLSMKHPRATLRHH